MKELSAYDIANALAGRPGSPELELRLLMLFQSQAHDRVEREQESVGNVLPLAA